MTTDTMSNTDRFELPDLLVTLCEAGQTSLAAKIARSLLSANGSAGGGARPLSRPGSQPGGARGAGRRSAPGGAGHARDGGERGGEDLDVAADEPEPARAIEALESDLQPPRHRR